MSLRVDKTLKTVCLDAKNASKAEIKEFEKLQAEGYKVLHETDMDGHAGPMPHNMGIHTDSRLF